MQWHKPARFRRVCPLLVSTPDGLRCSVNTADVRPFWGRALGYYGSGFFALYGVGVISVFLLLRTVGYPVSIFEVGLPPLWHRLAQARGWFFFEQSKRAFAAGNSQSGVMFLANAYEFDPANYNIGITLAKNYQVGQPLLADEVFAQLMRDHPGRQAATAQDWFRALLPRGNFEKIAALAREEIVSNSAQAHVWMRALLFATRQNRNDEPLQTLLADARPTATVWHRLLQTELHVRAGRREEARRALLETWPPTAPPRPAIDQFMVVYRVGALTALRDTFSALDLLGSSPSLDDEARQTLKLDAFATAGARNTLEREIDRLLAPRLTTANLATVKILCAHLIRHPDRDIFRRLFDKLAREPVPLDSDTAGIWFSLLTTAGAVGDLPRLRTLTEQLKAASKTPFTALTLVEAYFRGQTAERQITSFLPFLPLPTEVTYALIERFETPRASDPKTPAAPKP